MRQLALRPQLRTSQRKTIFVLEDTTAMHPRIQRLERRFKLCARQVPTCLQSEQKRLQAVSIAPSATTVTIIYRLDRLSRQLPVQPASSASRRQAVLLLPKIAWLASSAVRKQAQPMTAHGVSIKIKQRKPPASSAPTRACAPSKVFQRQKIVQ